MKTLSFGSVEGFFFGGDEVDLRRKETGDRLWALVVDYLLFFFSNYSPHILVFSNPQIQYFPFHAFCTAAPTHFFLHYKHSKNIQEFSHIYKPVTTTLWWSHSMTKINEKQINLLTRTPLDGSSDWFLIDKHVLSVFFQRALKRPCLFNRNILMCSSRQRKLSVIIWFPWRGVPPYDGKPFWRQFFFLIVQQSNLNKSEGRSKWHCGFVLWKVWRLALAWVP